MSKRKQRLTVAYAVEEMEVTFTVRDADDKPLKSRTFVMDEVHDSLTDRVSLYGLNKLLTDRTSEHKDKLAKLEAMQEVMARLKDGEWAKERAIGAPVVSANVEALARLKKISVPAAQKALAEYPKDTRDRILANPKVQELAEQIAAERKEAEAADLDDLLEE